MDFGKRTTVESFFDGSLASKKVTYTVPIRVQDRNQALSEMMKSLDVLSSRKSDGVTLSIETDKKSGAIRMITKTYTVDE